MRGRGDQHAKGGAYLESMCDFSLGMTTAAGETICRRSSGGPSARISVQSIATSARSLISKSFESNSYGRTGSYQHVDNRALKYDHNTIGCIRTVIMTITEMTTCMMGFRLSQSLDHDSNHDPIMIACLLITLSGDRKVPVDWDCKRIAIKRTSWIRFPPFRHLPLRGHHLCCSKSDPGI